MKKINEAIVRKSDEDEHTLHWLTVRECLPRRWHQLGGKKEEES